MPFDLSQSCSRILLEETLRKDYLKKMRSSKMEPLKKAELMKKIVKKCNSKAVKCSKCGYMNGFASIFSLDDSIVTERERSLVILFHFFVPSVNFMLI